jgi:hypothetical protein
VTDQERGWLGKVLSRLLAAVDNLDDESTFRNISRQEKFELSEMIGRLCNVASEKPPAGAKLCTHYQVHFEYGATTRCATCSSEVRRYADGEWYLVG